MIPTYWKLEDIPADFGPSVATIGNFDGVHLGHQKILTATRDKAKKNAWQSVAVTFQPHPTTIVAPERALALLTQPVQRVPLFEQQGIETALILPFTREMARLSPEEFVQRVLVDMLRAKAVVVGEGFRFGRGQAGNTEVLRRLGEDLGFEVETVEAVVVAGSAVSSSRVRDLVRQGQVDQARGLLGRPFGFAGRIVRGRGVGSKKTVPTLNLVPDTDLTPADGVYVTSSCDPDSGRRWESVTNIGLRPTFDGTEHSIETFLLSEFDGQAPERLEVAFYDRLRDEKRFASVEELREQILADAARAERFFRRLGAEGQNMPVSGSH